MNSTRVVTFMPTGRRVSVPSGALLLDVCREAGLEVAAPCGGHGTCGKCRVQVLDATAGAGAAGWRLACQFVVDRDLAVRVPAPRRDADAVSVADFLGRDPVPDGAARGVALALPPPELDDQVSDLARLARGLGLSAAELECPLPLLRELPARLRRADFRGVAVTLGRSLLDFAPPDTAAPLGAAVDIGTTTLALALCDLATGKVLATASAGNPQSALGDDVISRIGHAGSSPAAARDLMARARDGVDALLGAACASAGAAPARVVLAAVAANPAMHHLYLGLDAAAIARGPFVPCDISGRWLNGGEVAFGGAAGAKVYTLPAIGAYLGGDVVAGLLAHEVHDAPANLLYLDVGTNGEMVLRAGGRTLACSTAAGPAFEGARISRGMRAAPGAISGVRWRGGEWRIDIVPGLPGAADARGGKTGGGAPPARGLCGTGLLDAVAVLLDMGAIDETGALVDADEWRRARPDLPAEIFARRVETGDGQAAFVLAADGEGGPILLTQRDIREFQLAKGAVAAGVEVLLNAAGARAADLDAVILAGGFGLFLRPASALRTGLLPAGVAEDRIHPVGNAALAGARLCLLEAEGRRRAERLAGEVESLELSGRADFQAAFVEQMLFPSH